MSSLIYMSDFRSSFHDRRLARGMTQEEAAKSARLSRKTVSDFENGNSSISVANLSRLLGVVGLELAVREARRRPTLDELVERNRSAEPAQAVARRARARRKLVKG